MADMTLLQAIAFIEGLPKKIGEDGVKVMKEEFNHKNRPWATGETTESFHYEIAGNVIFIGSGTKGAYYVEKGRGAVVPKTKKWLRWQHGGKEYFAKKVGPVAPDDYIGRTAKRLQSMDFR